MEGIVVQDHERNFINKIAWKIGEEANNQAEVKALIAGIKICLKMGISNIKGEYLQIIISVMPENT